MFAVIFFVFGAIIGSFLNVVGLRFRSGLTLGGRSFCPSCGKELRARELVPLLSFLWLRGRCSNCKARISIQYPVVEACTGAIAVSLYLVFGLGLSLILAFVIFCFYIAILIYDLRHKIIPNEFVYASLVFAIIFRIVNGGGVLDWFAGPILFSVFGLIWLLSKGRAMGFGDAKLVLSIGVFLGGALGFSAIVLAFWLGTLVAVPLMLFSKKGITMKSEIPFAPYLIMGAWVSLYFGFDLFHVHSFFI